MISTNPRSSGEAWVQLGESADNAELVESGYVLEQSEVFERSCFQNRLNENMYLSLENHQAKPGYEQKPLQVIIALPVERPLELCLEHLL